MADPIPFVDYLKLGAKPHLEAQACASCGARFFDRRNACAHCSGTSFKTVPIPTEGELRTFTIVSFAAPGIPVPFVSGVVDCGGTSVRANIVNCPADPEHVKTGMKVRLTTFAIGQDKQGTEAINFGFEPIA
ncbi:MAG: OB-fold domain-containing protein [Myxococcota bacterium]